MHFDCSRCSLCSKYQPATSRFPQKPWATDDYRCARTAWKLAVPSLFSLFSTAQKSEKRLLERTGSACRFDERSARSVTMAAVCIPCDLIKNMNLASPVGAVCAFPPREMDFAPRSHVLPSSGATDPEAPPLQPDERDPAPRPGRGIGQYRPQLQRQPQRDFPARSSTLYRRRLRRGQQH